ncbi:MAG: sulfite exporter TauE/SafE family protein [Deltaproteobacteria bacterium]|nr:sulfite exporter TauE/SafE family protein [Deltaproteobacteria bacterium]
MSLSVYLPVAGCSLNIFLLLGMGGLVGFLSGLFGVGGGFLLTPLLIMIGVPPTVSAASDSNQIVAASASGTYAHSRAGSVDFKMGLLLLLGGVAGGSVGVIIIKMLRALGAADFTIKVTYIIMLGGVGAYMFFESLGNLRGTRQARIPFEEPKPSIYARIVGALPLRTEFKRSRVTLSILVPLLLGVLVGILAAIMGVGGGFIMVPVMVYLLRMPMHVVVGTSLFQILFTCLNVTVLQASVNHTVDILLALILLIGSVIGAQLGAKVSRRLKGDQLKILMAVIVLVVMVKMLVGLLVAPDILLAYRGGH